MDLDERKDPRERPADPAGTRPRHNPDDLIPPPPAVHTAPASGALWLEDDAAPADAVPAHEAPAVPPAPGTEQDPDGVLAAVAGPEPAAGAPALPEKDAARMRLVVAAIFAVAIVGLGSAVLLALNDEAAPGPSGPAWSPWKPDGDASERVATIADRVGRAYRGAGGSQLVVVTGGPLEVAGLPLTVALRESPADGGDVQLAGGKGVLYRLCGLGDKCAIAAGKPSQERHLLLRREALELALYTLHYTDADQVVVFMPPGKGKSPDQALFFRRSDLEPQLQSPLRKTLAPITPTVASVTRSPDARFVQDVTLQTIFKFSLTQGNNDNRAFLVLDPLS